MNHKWNYQPITPEHGKGITFGIANTEVNPPCAAAKLPV